MGELGDGRFSQIVRRSSCQVSEGEVLVSTLLVHGVRVAVGSAMPGASKYLSREWNGRGEAAGGSATDAHHT